MYVIPVHAIILVAEDWPDLEWGSIRSWFKTWM